MARCSYWEKLIAAQETSCPLWDPKVRRSFPVICLWIASCVSRFSPHTHILLNSISMELPSCLLLVASPPRALLVPPRWVRVRFFWNQSHCVWLLATLQDGCSLLLRNVSTFSNRTTARRVLLFERGSFIGLLFPFCSELFLGNNISMYGSISV
jgi:hypothetical protein